MKTIDGVPETITHQQVLDAVAILGLDPNLVRAMKFGLGYVEVTVHVSKPATIKKDEDKVGEHVVFYDTPKVPA